MIHLAYYNEHDAFAAAWLRELIKAGRIMPGYVDTRDIQDVRPSDLTGFTQHHFFAGIGVWSYALRRAGWPDSRPVWTGSCPCQPFSDAGQSGGFTDERHLWPAWFHLITQQRPERIFGEQVASKDGLAWLDLVQADLEGAGYASGAVDLCAAGVGAPHRRQRLWFMAHAERDGLNGCRDFGQGRRFESSNRRGPCGVALDDTAGARHPWPQQDTEGAARDQARLRVLGERSVAGVAQGNAVGKRLEGGDARTLGEERQTLERTGEARGVVNAARQQKGIPRRTRKPGTTNGFWADADWINCTDGKTRPVRPGTFPLAYGATARVGRLRGYGNAINAEAAISIIEASLEVWP